MTELLEQAIARLKSLPTDRQDEIAALILEELEADQNRNQRLDKLNQIYAVESSELDPVIAKMQFVSLPREDW